ncbi:MAG: hypothetical protein H2184_13255 [Candidatus Galacturonibacter soehngenii]|nr:hypothetical protein [Candidatus Galacturonibacter soehngenii]
MNSSDNIFNAFEVVNKTHENVNKLMNYCKNIVNEKGGYVLASPKFLRWKSDGNYAGWNTNSFILLFQDSNDQKLDNEWRDGPVYVLEIDLYNPEAYEKPMVVIAKFQYENIASWTEGCSPANHYIFYDPLYSFDYNYIKEDFLVAEMEENFKQRYWGLNRVVCIEIPLIEITGDNAYDKIFGGFNRMKEI